MSLVAKDIDKSVVMGSLEEADIAENDFIPFYDISAQFEPKQRKTTLASLLDVIRRVFGALPQVSASDAGKTVVVGSDGTYQLSATKVDVTESFLIGPDNWQHSTEVSPFNWYAEVTATTPIGTDSVVELVNNDPFSFSNYGFAIAEAAGQTIRFLAYSIPGDWHEMKVIVHG